MGHPRYTAEEIVRRGQQIYEQDIRARVETEERGKYILIDIETGEYQVGDNYHAVARGMLAGKPDAALCALRIGYPALGKLGGRWNIRKEAPGMGHPRYSNHEVVERGKELYEAQIRSRVEEGNRGKSLVIDVETGGYEMDDDAMAATRGALAKHPGAPLFLMRIGYPTFGKLGGGWGNLKR